MVGQLQTIGNPLTGYELGGTFGSQFILVNGVPGSADAYDFKNFGYVNVQWRATGSMAGSVQCSNDGTNFVNLNIQNMPGAETRYVSLSVLGDNGSVLPRWLKFLIGSVASGTVTGSGFCDVFARAL